jgi:hypothetical protein
MPLVLHLALLSLSSPEVLYAKLEDLKEPDWSSPAAVEEDFYSRVGELKVPEWFDPSDLAPPPASEGEADALYVELDDLKQPY